MVLLVDFYQSVPHQSFHVTVLGLPEVNTGERTGDDASPKIESPECGRASSARHTVWLDHRSLDVKWSSAHGTGPLSRKVRMLAHANRKNNRTVFPEPLAQLPTT